MLKKKKASPGSIKAEENKVSRSNEIQCNSVLVYKNDMI
jgi:hypothetical protein